MKKIATLFTLLFFTFFGVYAQVTTASLSGVVSSGDETIPGATVVAVHGPSGTRYGAISSGDGLFDIQGMRVGGPYTIEVSFIGYATAVFEEVTLRLGETYMLDVELNESATQLSEITIVGDRSKFAGKKTGAITNISNTQLGIMPTIDRSLEDFTRLSPYSGGGTDFAGHDGRMSSFTIDGANLNNNFGLSSNLPGGGNPISLDAIQEVQVVIAPFDVRQTNFIGGGINAITKSGTNSFQGSAYTYQRNQNMRGNKIDGDDLGDRAAESLSTYGFTVGGPIIKNKLFFFVNGEYENSPAPIHNWKLSTDGVSDADNYISRVTADDLEEFANILINDYGYDPGSYSKYDGGTTNYKALARIDWNINNANKLSLRFNYTTNSTANPTNATSTVGTRAASGRISKDAMAFLDNCYFMDNNVLSIAGELNSKINDKISNKLLVTYSSIVDQRSSDSDPFPHIDIWEGGNAFMSAGYELFSWNNKVGNTIFNANDYVTLIYGSHNITAGASFEYQNAVNNFMRYGTGYYKYASLDDFRNGVAPIAFGLTYGYGGELNPASEVSFAQSGVYAQDEWNITKKFKLTYGLRADMLNYLNEMETNLGVLDIDFDGKTIDNGRWPDVSVQFSPRIGFNWDINGDKSLILRGGTGVFTGRIPLVFFTNMPTNAGMLQNTVSITEAADLAILAGGMITDVNEMISTLGLPTAPSYATEADISRATVVGIDPAFKLPQLWKNTIAVDYQLPIEMPVTLTVEGMFNKDINAVCMENYNVVDPSSLPTFAGPDNRLDYGSSAAAMVSPRVTSGAIVLKNTSEGYSGTANVMVTAQPVTNMNLMASYTYTVAKEISGNPGSQAYSAWNNLPSVDGPNLVDLHNSQYLTPNKVIGSFSYKIEYANNFATNIGLYYAGYNTGMLSYMYSNDMNQDGQTYDLIYIPAAANELTFVDANGFTAAQQAAAFWNFVEQDNYLSKHKGEYAEAYGAKMPWLNRIDLKLTEEFKIKAGTTTNTLQLSLDILNFGNLINSGWGLVQSSSPSNYGKILKYEGKTASNVPTYSMYYSTDAGGTRYLPSTSFTNNRVYTNCWQLQIGVRYIFN